MIEETKREDDAVEVFERTKSPPWDEIVLIIINNFIEADLEIKKNKEQSPEMQLNLSNLTAIFSQILEVYSFSSFGFAKQVG